MTFMNGEYGVVESDIEVKVNAVEQIMRSGGDTYSVCKDGKNWKLVPVGGWESPDNNKSETKFIVVDVENHKKGDGAIIEIPNRGATPVQVVVNENQTFSEVPVSGELVLLLVSPEGEMFVKYFDNNSKHKGYLSKGWVMTWISVGDKKGKVFEYSEPKFKDGDLGIVGDKEESFGGTKILKEFWELRKFLMAKK